MSVSHPELQSEQAHLDRAYGRLESMRATAAEALQRALGQGGGGTFAAVVEREVMVENWLRRLDALALGDEALCFGRIDREDGAALHIGRLAIADEDLEPLVIDWRAPAAEPFYRATGRHPLGLRRRRHFLTEGRRISRIEDEVFGVEGGDGEAAADAGLAGPGALLAALEQSRTGRMRDIVATVQREQDEIIRAPLQGVLVVQGGPGTGKTAVALHRAAYLLYTHRFPLERQGVLVVGPNRLFLRYIEHVLPSLGESGVELSTVVGLVPNVRAVAPEPLAVARLKGDARMAQVVARAVGDRERGLRRPVVVGFGLINLRMTPEVSADIVRIARRSRGTHNARRPLVERLFFSRLKDSNPAAAEADVNDVITEVRRHPDVVAALERMWPVLTPQQLLHDLFGAPSLVDSAAARTLGEEERRLLDRPRSEHVSDVAWSAGDAALLDEAAALLGPTRKDQEELRTFGHIIVDEAQDLTPMQLRMLGRRSISGSMTLVGDIAQATGPWGPARWDEVLAHLRARSPQTVELTVNYRTTREIMDLAARVLRRVLPDAEVASSVRTGERPRFVAADAAGIAAAAAREAGAQVQGRDSVAVICAESLAPAVGEALADAGLDFGETGHRGLDAPITLVPVGLAKGLEFDAVVVVDPDRIVEETAQGLRSLYVALTRPTKRLVVVHTEPLDPLLDPRQPLRGEGV